MDVYDHRVKQICRNVISAPDSVCAAKKENSSRLRTLVEFAVHQPACDEFSRLSLERQERAIKFGLNGIVVKRVSQSYQRKVPAEITRTQLQAYLQAVAEFSRRMFAEQQLEAESQPSVGPGRTRHYPRPRPAAAPAPPPPRRSAQWPSSSSSSSWSPSRTETTSSTQSRHSATGQSKAKGSGWDALLGFLHEAEGPGTPSLRSANSRVSRRGP